MSAGAIVEELERLGVELRVAGDDLEYEGPEEAITPELLNRLRRHKTELVRVLSGDHASGLAVELGPAACELRAAGWKHKERCGKTIWQSPVNSFWYSQDMAMHLQNQERTLS
jgi:hypothetical protein